MTTAKKWLLATALLLASGGVVAMAGLSEDQRGELSKLVSSGFAATSALFESKPETKAYIYDTATITKGDIRHVVATTGTVRPRMTVQVGSELSGRIKQIVADFNSRVKAGDLLAVIDPNTFESKLRQAAADVASAEAEVSSAEAAVRKSKSVLANAEIVLKRQQMLDAKHIAAAVTVQESLRDVQVGRAEVDAAEANLANAKAHLAQRKAQHDQAQIDLDRTRIRAPIDGIVLHRAIDVGQTVAASFQAPELFRLAGDLASVHIEAQVGEADIGAVKDGQEVVFDVDAYPRRTFKGKVEQIRLAPTAAESVVTYTVIIGADNPDLMLYPGMTANVRVETARLDDVVRAPSEAISFKPPRQMAELARRMSEADHVVESLGRNLQLDVEQTARVKERISGGGDSSSTGSKKKKRGGAAVDISSDGLFDDVLRPDQKERLAAWRKQWADTQQASVWVLDGAGVPRERKVRVGLADITHTHLADAGLSPGDTVIVRSRKARSK